MKHLRTYESFENWGFQEWVIDSLTFILDYYDHHIADGIITLNTHNDSEIVLDEVKELLEPLKSKFNFDVTIYARDIKIFQYKPESYEYIKDILDNLVCVDVKKIYNGEEKTFNYKNDFFVRQNTREKQFIVYKDYWKELFKIEGDYIAKHTNHVILILNHNLEKHFGVSGYSSYRTDKKESSYR